MYRWTFSYTPITNLIYSSFLRGKNTQVYLSFFSSLVGQKKNRNERKIFYDALLVDKFYKSERKSFEISMGSSRGQLGRYDILPAPLQY